VEREDFELLKLALAQPGRGVVIEGPSGVGKTTAIEKAIEDLQTDTFESKNKLSIQILRARDPEDVLKLQTLRQWHQGTIVVDDFHRLELALRKDLVDLYCPH
jgi:MoxR-like ATPase